MSRTVRTPHSNFDAMRLYTSPCSCNLRIISTSPSVNVARGWFSPRRSRFQLSLLAHPDHFHTSQFANYYVQIFTSSRIAKFCEFTTPKPWVHYTKAPHRCTTTTPYYVGGLGSWCK